MRCANCGGEVPPGSRFCPHCSAPQPEPRHVTELDEVPVAEPAPETARPEVAPEPPPRRWRWSYAYTLLVFVAAAIVAFAIVAISLGLLTRDLFGL